MPRSLARLATAGLAAWILAACANPAGPTSSPGRSETPANPTPTVIPSTVTQPSPTAVAAADLPRDSLASVIEGPLLVRSRPWVGADSEVLDDRQLQTGQQLFVIDGPVPGSDYLWYLVHAIEGGGFNAGWVAAAPVGGASWLEPSSTTCPEDPSFAELGELPRPVRLSCYGSRDFELTETISWGPMCGDGNSLAGPEWMTDCFSVFDMGADMHLAVPPELADVLGEREAEDSFRVTVTAHMDDPEALTCRLVAGWEGEIDYELANPGKVLQCRTMLVATELELAE